MAMIQTETWYGSTLPIAPGDCCREQNPRKNAAEKTDGLGDAANPRVDDAKDQNQ